MKIFLTGTTGFIGKHLLKRLIEDKHQVTVLVRNQQKKEFLRNMGAKIVLGDILNPTKYINVLNSCDVLIHLAGLRTNWATEEDFGAINGRSILKLVNKKSSLKHIIVLSSVYVMGKLQYLPANEEHPLLAGDLYGKSKIVLENCTKQIGKDCNIPYTIIRPAIVYGPGDNDIGMIVKLIKLVRNKRFFFIGNGKNLLHLIYIDDLVSGILKALKLPGQNRTFILAGEQPITLLGLVGLIKKETKTSYRPKFIPKSPLKTLAFFVEKFYFTGFKVFPKLFSKDPFLSGAKISVISDNWYYDISKAKKELGFNPQVDYRHGIKKTVKYYR